MAVRPAATKKIDALISSPRSDRLALARALSDLKGVLKSDDKDKIDSGLVDKFKEHRIHEVLAECAKLRPSVDIFVE